MDTHILKATDIGVTYSSPEGQHDVLRGVGFTVGAGEFITIVGPSGTGKTTLLRCLAGLQRPHAGSISLKGNDVQGPSGEVSVVFQDYSRSLLPWMRVIDNVALPMRVIGMGRGERHARAEELLRSVGLAGTGRKYPWQLSGGMQQRVALARGLINEPEVLLMDEPFASVDAQTRFELEDLSLAIRNRTGVSVVLVTHDVDEAVYLGDRVLVLAGSPASVKDVIDVPFGRTRDQITTRAEPAFTELRTRVLAEITNRGAATAAGSQ